MEENAATYELVIQRVFEAPRASVWSAWTTEEKREWCCPKGFTCSVATPGVSVGGNYSYTLDGPDNKKHVVSGVYREIRKNERLVFTHSWEDESYPSGQEPVVRVELKAFGIGRTKMNFSQKNLSTSEALKGYRQGWDESFDKLEALLNSQED